MTFLLAAAGTGGHVFPGLAVGQALADLGVPKGAILYVGGDRLEAEIYPGHGFPFLEVEVRGLARSLTTKNLGLPAVVLRARRTIEEAIRQHSTRAVLGLGGYVTIPTGMAARRLRIPFFNAEQNAVAGLANRVSARWARKSFVSFPVTRGLPGGIWVGNPVRRQFWEFERDELRREAMGRYGLDSAVPVLGVVGGSLGSGLLNEAVSRLARTWVGPPIQIVHLTGRRFHDSLSKLRSAGSVIWLMLPFEDKMEQFYAVSDLVLARAGGAVAELTATATPALVVPGDFGSGGHQRGNAAFLTEAGAVMTVEESELDRLDDVLGTTLLSPGTLGSMREAAAAVARPRAAHAIAEEMIEAAR